MAVKALPARPYRSRVTFRKGTSVGIFLNSSPSHLSLPPGPSRPCPPGSPGLSPPGRAALPAAAPSPAARRHSGRKHPGGRRQGGPLPPLPNEPRRFPTTTRPTAAASGGTAGRLGSTARSSGPGKAPQRRRRGGTKRGLPRPVPPVSAPGATLPSAPRGRPPPPGATCPLPPASNLPAGRGRASRGRSPAHSPVCSRGGRRRGRGGQGRERAGERRRAACLLPDRGRGGEPGRGEEQSGAERSGAGAASPGAAGPGAARCTGPGRNPRNDGILLLAGGESGAAPLAGPRYEVSIIRVMRR